MECKFSAFIVQFALQNSTFQVLAMTLDKYIAIKWPHKAATYSVLQRAKIIIIVVFICTLTYNIPILFLSSVIGHLCFANSIGGDVTVIYSWFSFVINAIIPFSMLIYMNFVIVKTVRHSSKMFGENGTSTRAHDGQVASVAITKGMELRQKAMKSAESQLTILLLLVTTLFLILNVPVYVRIVFVTIFKRDSPQKYASTILFYQTSHKLLNTNFGINFFLYCLSGRKFRNDLKDILSCNRKSNFSSGASPNVTEISNVH